MLKRNLITAFRKLWNKKEFTFLNVLGLTVGITTSLFILLWVQDELAFDAYHTDIDRTYAVWSDFYANDGQIYSGSYQSAIVQEHLKENYPDFEKVTRVNYYAEHQLAGSTGEKFKDFGYRVDPEFFQIFDFKIIDGAITEDLLTTSDQIVLTESVARLIFGKVDVVGELVKIDNRDDKVVQMVVADPPKNTRFQFPFAISAGAWSDANQWTKGWGNTSSEIFAKLNASAEPERVAAKIQDVINDNGNFGRKDLILKPFNEMYLKAEHENGQAVGGRIEYVRLFGIVAAIIILIASINFINLSVADSFKRAKEIGVRKVNGASRNQLVASFMLESGLIVLIASLLSIILIEGTLPAFNELTGKGIELQLTNPEIWGAVLALALLTTLASGLYPAFVLSKFKTVQALKGKIDRKGASGFAANMRKGLVVFQYLAAGTLIFATIIISQQMDFIFENENNVDKDNVIVLKNDDMLIYQFDEFKTELLKDPSIASVTALDNLPIDVGTSTGDPKWEGMDPDKSLNFKMIWSEPEFLTTMRLDVVEGRDFRHELKSDTAGVILNETAIKQMEIEDPIGQKLKFWGMEATIIGVVEDFYLNSVYEEIQPLLLLNYTAQTRYITVRAAEGQSQRAVETLRAAYAQFMPDHLFDYEFMEVAHENMYKSEVMIKKLASLFGFIAIFISCLGLYGLTSINAQRSIKEIGVRKVLGASVTQIIALMSRQSLALPLAALLIMSPLAYFMMSEWLSGFVYHIEISIWSVLAVVVGALAIAWATISVIAFNAARINPVNSLRND